jgi:undecaprenyl-diphosphatase
VQKPGRYLKKYSFRAEAGEFYDLRRSQMTCRDKIAKRLLTPVQRLGLGSLMKSYGTERPTVYNGKKAQASVDTLFGRCNRWEIGLVRKAVQSVSSPGIRGVCKCVNSFAAGWLYGAIALILLGLQVVPGLRLILVAGLAATLAHTIYPIVKSRIARLRPFEIDSSVDLSMKALDRYSCPSGHIMTATVVAIPLGKMFPILLPGIVCVWVIIAWARVSSGHHYPSDILLGALLGSFVALPITSWLL